MKTLDLVCEEMIFAVTTSDETYDWDCFSILKKDRKAYCHKNKINNVFSGNVKESAFSHFSRRILYAFSESFPATAL